MTGDVLHNLLWVGGILALLGVALLFLWFCRTMTVYFLHPKRPDPATIAHCWAQATGLPEPVRATLKTTDGIAIQLIWFPQPGEDAHATVIAGHGSTSYKEELLPFASQLYAEGCQVALFDFRGHGESTGNASTIGLEEVEDLRTALEWVQHRPEVAPDNLFLLGHSMGAVTSINYLAHYADTIRGVFLLAPFATIDRALHNRLNRLPVPTRPSKAVMKIIARQRLGRDIMANMPLNLIGSIRTTHLCLVHGTADRGNNPQDSVDLFEQARTTRELHWLEGVTHQGIIYEPEAWRVVRAALQAIRAGTPNTMDTPPERPAYANAALTQKQARPT